MASSRRYIISSAVFIQLLMLTAVASPLADGVNPVGDFTKMNDDLLEELENNDNSKAIPVIDGHKWSFPSRSNSQRTGLSKLPRCGVVSNGFNVP